jgi:hypothetical protein
VAKRAGLAALACTFFLAALDDPPQELEATHADIANLVMSLTSRSDLDEDPGAAREALDAIDDGLPADAVALRLHRLLPPGADAMTILRDRAAAAG